MPTMPGRHIVIEVDGILTLNAATYKVDHTVKFVLLDDALLVARKRRRRNNSESEKLVAERCWMLSEMLVLDTKDTPGISFLCFVTAPGLTFHSNEQRFQDPAWQGDTRLSDRDICGQEESTLSIPTCRRRTCSEETKRAGR